MLRTALAVLSLCCLSLPAQDRAETPKKLRVHVIGASVSGGFRDGPQTGAEETGDSITMQHLLRRWCGDHARATTHGTIQMMLMFTDPLRIGEEQLEGVRKAEPDVVVAIDYLFWFAYGYVGDGDEAELRAERLEQGLELLGSLSMPVVIGDLPDMAGAARRMLSPRQIPSPEMLARLNERLRAWAADRPNVHVVALAETVRQMRTEGVALPLAGGPLPTAPGALQQADKLHANRLGMALLGLRMQDALRACFPDGHPLAQRQWTFEQFVEAAGAEGDLELQREAAAATAEATSGK